MSPPGTTVCSFCGKSQYAALKLIAGPGVFICDSCINVCKDILDRELRGSTPPADPSAITLRRATAEDEAAVLQLTTDFATSFKVLPEEFAKVRTAPNTYINVAVAGTLVVGYALGHAHTTLFATGSVAWLEEIMLRQDFRRAGIGKMLMEDFEKWARIKSCRMVALATRRAAEFYKALGYEESATYFRKKLMQE